MKLFSFKLLQKSPHVKESRSGTCIWIKLDTGFLELYSGFQSPGVRIPQAKFSRILESPFPYIGRQKDQKFPFPLILAV